MNNKKIYIKYITKTIKAITQKLGHSEDVSFLISCEIEFFVENQQHLQVDSKEIQLIYSKIQEIGYKNSIIVNEIEKEDGFNQFEIQTLPTNNMEALACFVSAFQEKSFLLKNKINLDPRYLNEFPSSGIHYHVSLYDCNNVNLFTSPPLGKKYSIMDNAIGGLLGLMKKSMTIFAPTQQCYKRYQTDRKGIYKNQPTAYSWGINNRTCSIRIPKSTLESLSDTRIEHRLPSTLSNPFEVIPVIIGSIGYGIHHEAKPPKPIFGDVFDPIYHEQCIRLPISLQESQDSSLPIEDLMEWLTEVRD